MEILYWPVKKKTQPPMPPDLLDWDEVYGWCDYGTYTPLKRAIRSLALAHEWLQKAEGEAYCSPRQRVYAGINLKEVRAFQDVVNQLAQSFSVVDAGPWTEAAKEECRRSYALDLYHLLLVVPQGISHITSDADALSALQRIEPVWEQAKTWKRGGCFILADGISRFLAFHGCQSERVAVWETWDEVPDHVFVQIGGRVCMDCEGEHTRSSVLRSWGDFVGGGVLLAPISQEQARSYGVPVDDELSQSIALALEGHYQSIAVTD